MLAQGKGEREFCQTEAQPQVKLMSRKIFLSDLRTKAAWVHTDTQFYQFRLSRPEPFDLTLGVGITMREYAVLSRTPSIYSRLNPLPVLCISICTLLTSFLRLQQQKEKRVKIAIVHSESATESLHEKPGTFFFHEKPGNSCKRRKKKVTQAGGRQMLSVSDEISFPSTR